MEKYSDQAWVMRYRKERDAALRAHKRQYRRRQILSKFGLARAPVSDQYERFIDVDRVRSEMMAVAAWCLVLLNRPRPMPAEFLMHMINLSLRIHAHTHITRSPYARTRNSTRRSAEAGCPSDAKCQARGARGRIGDRRVGWWVWGAIDL
jgi:hypothetical protein